MKQTPPSAGLGSLIQPYKGMLGIMLLFTVLANALNLAFPKLIARAIDAFTAGSFEPTRILVEFIAVILAMFVCTALQSLMQTLTSERVAKDLRATLAQAVSQQSFAAIQRMTPAKLLTNLTSDVDAVKNFVAQAIVSIVSSVFVIIGASILLLITDWKLALIVLCSIPIIGVTFFFVFGKVRVLFTRAQGIIDRLNKVINESILGAMLIRVLNTQQREYDKFIEVNTSAKDTGMSILRLFAAMIPIIMFVANMAMLAILLVGGRYVILGDLTLGNFTAFNTYLGMLIFPIIMIGFMSNFIAQAGASYQRLQEVLTAPAYTPPTQPPTQLHGAIDVQNISLAYEGKSVLRDVSFQIRPKTKTAIIGPTGAGKTQLLNILIGLTAPTSGEVRFDGTPLADINKTSLHEQVGLVFQDSALFNTTLRENIAFHTSANEEPVDRAIQAAELNDFIGTLPEGMNTMVSERGTTLSGGQKQRVMLARALSLDPKILLLDDFTARVDALTEQRILENVEKLYPDLTLINVTQKISSIEHYDHIIVLMEGEVLAQGTHEELMHQSPEYVQIYESQRSTNQYDVRSH